MGCDRARGLLLAVSMAALFAGPAGARAQDDDPPPLAPPGRLVDVGGWRLHLHCTDTADPGRPTVILEAGRAAHVAFARSVDG